MEGRRAHIESVPDVRKGAGRGTLILVAWGRPDAFLHKTSLGSVVYRIIRTGETNKTVVVLFDSAFVWLKGIVEFFHAACYAVIIAVYVIIMPVLSVERYLVAVNQEKNVPLTGKNNLQGKICQLPAREIDINK